MPDGINWKFVKKFKKIIEEKVKDGFRFIIIAGGGKTARNYVDAIDQVEKINDEDRDWIGIHATRLNAHFIKTIFRKIAHPVINKDPYETGAFKKSNKPILIAAGWRPGNSTDLVAVTLAKHLGIKNVVNLSNIDYLCDKDPKKYPDAKKIKKISWKEFCKIVGNKWDPGMNTPFDPIAAKLAEKEDIEVAIMNGNKLTNLKKYIAEENFIGTIVN